jgi:hypothetical protein
MVVIHHRRAPLLLLAASLALAFFLSCRADPAPDAGFLDNPELMVKEKQLPFNAIWFKDGFDFKNYDSVVIKDIDTSHLLKLDWWDKAVIAFKTKKFSPAAEAQYLARYYKEQLAKSFSSNKDQSFAVLAEPKDSSLIVELALVEVVPTKVWLNSISYLLIGPVSLGSTAMEGRLRDAKTGLVVCEFKDRELGQMDLVSIADLQWYSHSKHTIDNWADKIVEIFFAGPQGKVSASSTVTLRPW